MSKYPERLHETVARNGANVNSPERIALRELMEAVSEHTLRPSQISEARLTLALNAARNVLKAVR